MTMRLRRILAWTVVAIPVAALLALVVGYVLSDNDCEQQLAVTPQRPMTAVVRCDYGTADVLRLARLETPVPGDEEILVKVHAAAVNPLDWHEMRGTPYIMRLNTGLRRPTELRLGVDYAGTVEAVGAKVTRFKPGDTVFGGRSGALAQYLVARADRAVALKPENVSFEQAAGVGIAGTTALQALRDKGRLEAGNRVLVNGASGGVGTFAVQIAKSMGAEVTGVSSARNHELVRSLGADHLIDYKTQDYTAGEARYDVILDAVGNRSLSENRRVLVPDGRYVLVGGGGPDAGNWIGPMAKPLLALLMSPFVSQEMGLLLAQLTREDTQALAALMQSGAVTPVIDRRYPLAETAEAIRYLETGRARGKVIVTME
jgi:NADPH:quinone reductase-like Zn-dependent oxidoreductase